MFGRKRYMVFIMVVTLISIVLAGCSGTGGDTSTETETTDKTEVTKSSLRPEGVPDDINKR